MDASEYGRHWNFFFTLGALELLTLAAPQDPAAAGASGEPHCSTHGDCYPAGRQCSDALHPLCTHDACCSKR